MKEYDYRQKFQSSAQSYETITQSKYIQLVYGIEKAILRDLFERMDSMDKQAIDFACGSGRWTQYLEQHFRRVIGIDVSEKMIDLARNKCSKATFLCCDITSGDSSDMLPQDSFDVITTFRFYKNAQDDLRKSATDSLVRYLREDGLFVFDLHLNTFSIMGISACAIRKLGLHKLIGIGDLTVRTISLKDIRQLFKGTPFEIVDYYGIGLLPGRTNYTLMPVKWLQRLEMFFTKHKVLRPFAYSLLVIARKKRTGAIDQSWA